MKTETVDKKEYAMSWLRGYVGAEDKPLAEYVTEARLNDGTFDKEFVEQVGMLNEYDTTIWSDPSGDIIVTRLGDYPFKIYPDLVKIEKFGCLYDPETKTTYSANTDWSPDLEDGTFVDDIDCDEKEDILAEIAKIMR